MTTVLVAYASRMGATASIAGAIVDELRSCGVVADLVDADDASATDGYDAVVLGSAVYVGRWRRSAVDLLRGLVRTGYPRRVWLFHSGPTGIDAPRISTPLPRKVALLADRLGAAPARTFPGRLEPDTAAGFLARRLAEHEKVGDYRDFRKVRVWARGIALSVTVAS